MIRWTAATGDSCRATDNNIDPDHLIDLMEHFFTKTRWRRTFMLVRGMTVQ
jgi:hypothetical protein